MWSFRDYPHRGLSLLCLALCQFPATSPAEPGKGNVGLVYGGKAQAVIVLAENPTRAAQVAARELNHYVKEITGQELPVYVDSMVPRRSWRPRRVLIGESALTRELGLRSADFQEQEYLIETRGTDLILLGRDATEYGLISYEKNGLWPTAGRRPPDFLFTPMGTLYAVHTFLEKFCGVRWYLPGQLGEVCPRKKKLVFYNLFLRTRPWTRYRWSSRLFEPDPFDFYTGNPEKRPARISQREMFLWLVRMKIGGSRYAVNHSFYSYYNRFGKTHPEWWAGGKPKPRAHLDYLHPGLIQQGAQDAIDFFDGKLKDGKFPDGSHAFGAGDYYAAMPMDSSLGWVKTDAAKKLLRERAPGADGVPASKFFCGWASDYVFEFVNRIAENVSQKYPDKWITTTAYAPYFLPPQNVKVRPNVSVCVTGMVNSSFRPADREYFYKNLEAWGKITPELYVWEYYLAQAFGGFKVFPVIYPKRIAQGIQHMQKCGVRGMFFEDSGSPGLLANPAEQMLNRYVTWKYLCDTSVPVDKMLDEYYRLFYGPAARPMKQFLGGIQARWFATTKRKENQSRQRLSWEFLGPPEVLKKLAKPIRKAMQMDLPKPYKTRVRLAFKAIYEPMEKHCHEYQARLASRKRIQCPLAGAAPKIDGSLEEDAWKKAVRSSSFVDVNNAKKPTVTTVASIMRDEKNLYVAIACQEPNMKKIVANFDQKDDLQIAADCEVEVFLDVGRTAKKYYHILVNSLGNYADRAVGMDYKNFGLEWNSGAVIAARRRKDGYDVEMSIPLKAIGVDKIEPGQVWGANFGRCRGFINISDKEPRFTCWSPTYGGFNNPFEFGVMVMGD